MADALRVNALSQILQRLQPECSYEEYFTKMTQFKVGELLGIAMNEVSDHMVWSNVPSGMLVHQVNEFLGGELHLHCGDIVDPNDTTRIILEAVLFAVDQLWESQQTVVEEKIVDVMVKMRKLFDTEDHLQSQINNNDIECQQFEEDDKQMVAQLKHDRKVLRQLEPKYDEAEMKRNLKEIEDELTMLNNEVENLSQRFTVAEKFQQIPSLEGRMHAVEHSSLPTQSEADENDTLPNSLTETKEQLDIIQLDFDVLFNEHSKDDEIRGYELQYRNERNAIDQSNGNCRKVIAELRAENESVERKLNDAHVEEKVINSDSTKLDENIRNDLDISAKLEEDCFNVTNMYTTMIQLANDEVEQVLTISEEIDTLPG